MSRRCDHPVIGITTYAEPASWGVWRSVPADLLPHGYVRHVEQAGGIPLLVPPRLDPADVVVEEILDRLDALVVAGGADVEPSRYGAVPHASVQEPRPDRDSSELALVRAAVARDLPLLGICRGMQVMAVAAGGTLDQHLPDLTGSVAHSPGPGQYGTTQVTTQAGTRVAAILGPQVQVRCYHHQQVRTAPGYTVSARAGDGVLEAMEVPDARFRVAVQWHPEASTEIALMAALVEQLRSDRA